MGEGTKKINVFKLCRICMSKPGAGSNNTWLNIFTDTVSHAGQNMLIILEEVTGRLIKPDVELPEIICTSCWAAAKTAFKFKRRLEMSLQCLTERTDQKESTNSLNAQSEEEEFEFLSGDEITIKGRFNCSYCSKTYGDKTSLMYHTRIHTGERPFKCSYCSMTFRKNDYLRTHLRTHTGERPFECDLCQKTFIQQAHLRNHQRTHTGDRPFKCSQCPKRFGIRRNLENHLRIHTGEKPFKCTFCSKSFSQKFTLTNHLRTHTYERPYECLNCSKKFSIKSSLKRHNRIHMDKEVLSVS